MADKEERIYICSKETVCQICKDNCAEFDGIVPCGNCGYEDFPSMTRQEAIERMAKALCSTPFENCETCIGLKNKKLCKQTLESMKGDAAVALNALLEGVKK